MISPGNLLKCNLYRDNPRIEIIVLHISPRIYIRINIERDINYSCEFMNQLWHQQYWDVIS